MRPSPRSPLAFHAISLCSLAASVLVHPAIFAAPAEFHTLVAASNPALWYKFNEQTGATSVTNYGSLGASFNGIIPNGITANAPTLGGDSGFQFSAPAQQYVESLSPAPENFTGNPTFSAETVVFVVDNPTFFGYAPFLHWGAPFIGQSVFFSLQHSTTNRFYAGFYNGGIRSTCSLFSPGRWHHIVWTREGGRTQYQGTRLFVNGDEVAIQPDSYLVGATNINISSTTFRIQRSTDAERYFSGAMDEIVLYPRVLTADEVRSHYLALGTPATPPCRADFNGDCSLDFFDYLDFVQAFANSTFLADFNDDGVVDFFDYLDFVQAFSVGC